MTNTAELLTRAKALIEELAAAIPATPEVTGFSKEDTKLRAEGIANNLITFANWERTPQGKDFWNKFDDAFRALSRGDEAEFNRLVAEAVRVHP